MFEKAKPIPALTGAPANGLSAEGRARVHGAIAGGRAERFAGRMVRRSGDALRALEWSELTARLNAARDLRLLLRTENQAPIESAAASFGDAAASYFALIDDSQPDVNPDALDQSKGLGAIVEDHDADCFGEASSPRSDAPCGAAREMQ